MVYNSKKHIKIEDAQIIFRNFSGEKSQYNKDGKRTFSVILTDLDLVDQLRRDGWRPKPLKPRDEDDAEERYHLPVVVGFGKIKPLIHCHTSANSTLLDEETVGMLDIVDIVGVDLVLRPYEWDVQGDTGIKAYLKTMHVTIEEDEFASKYNDDDEDDKPFK
jgi:hypothetical protein